MNEPEDPRTAARKFIGDFIDYARRTRLLDRLAVLYPDMFRWLKPGEVQRYTPEDFRIPDEVSLKCRDEEIP